MSWMVVCKNDGNCHQFQYQLFSFSENGVSDSVEWVRFATLPLFIGQLIGAYEGIGCVSNKQIVNKKKSARIHV